MGSYPSTYIGVGVPAATMLPKLILLGLLCTVGHSLPYTTTETTQAFTETTETTEVFTETTETTETTPWTQSTDNTEDGNTETTAWTETTDISPSFVHISNAGK